jgi:thioredoxin 2
MASTIVLCDQCGQKNRVPEAAAGVARCGNCHAPLPWITDAGDDDFASIVEASVIPVLVDLWAPWCGPCRVVSPILERLAHDMAGRLKLVKVNVDAAPDLARRFGVQGIPTLLVFHKGAETSRQVGAAPEHALRSWLEQALPAAASSR